MSKQAKKGPVPELRFPKFKKRGEWEEVPFDRVVTVHKGKGIAKADITPNGKLPCIRYGELYTRYSEVIDEVFSRTDVDPAELFLSEAGDVIVPASGETKEDIATASCVLRDGVALGSDLNVLRSDANGAFLSYYINYSKKRAIANVAQGDAVVHLYPHQLNKLTLTLPKPDEQKKIATCLSSLDALLAAEREKLEALRDHKKGLMQQLFPAEGAKVPKLRFKGFKGEWGESVLGHEDIGWFVNERVAIEEISRTAYISTANILPDFAGVGEGASLPPTGSYTRFQVNDILISNIRPYLRKVWRATFDGAASNDVVVIRPMKKVMPSFLAHLIMSDAFIAYVMQSAKGLKMPRGEQSAMEVYPIFYPSSNEQKSIAQCLSSLVDGIVQLGKRITALEEHKKGLMQSLFPTVQS